MGNFLVIEICERSLCSAKLCSSYNKAVRVANNLLKKHMADLGCSDKYKARTEEQWKKASPKNDNAWCNLRHLDWDAYILALE